MPFDIPVQVSGFPAGGSLSNGPKLPQFSTADIIRAAIVAGYDLRARIDWRIQAWRVAAIRLALDLPPGALPGVNPRLSHPRPWKNLDPSEKASVNCLLGNTVTKLLAERLLNARWLWFLSLYSSRITPKFDSSQRPDFFTRTRAGDWISMEAKGRCYAPSVRRLTAAKTQAKSLGSINGAATKAHVVCWTMERDGCVEARFHDPPPDKEHEGESLEVEFSELIRDYYSPVHNIMEASEEVEHPKGLRLFRFGAGDFEIGLHPQVERLLQLTNTVAGAKDLHIDSEPLQPIGDVISGPDGVIVIPGQSWPP